MPVEVGRRVTVPGGRTGRVVAITETTVTVLVAYQSGSVEVVESFAPADVTAIE